MSHFPGILQQCRQCADPFAPFLDHLDEGVGQQGRPPGSQIVQEGFERLLTRLLGEKTGRGIELTLDIPAHGP